MSVIIDSFDFVLRKDAEDISYERDEKARGRRRRNQPSQYEIDTRILRNAERISIFWITETQSRAQRIDDLEKSGELVLDHDAYGYPWLRILSFKEQKIDVEI